MPKKPDFKTLENSDTSEFSACSKTPKDFDIYVGIPAYNAEKTISDVIERIKKLNLAHKIIVIDDGSKDNTRNAVKKFKDILFFENKINIGYGGTQKRIFKKFLEDSKNQNDILMLLHSDGQTLPEEIHLFVEKFLDKSIDIVLGSRALGDMRKGKMPLIRIIGDNILTKIENFCYNMRLTTYASGYRGFRNRQLRRMQFDDLRDRHTFDTELLVRANNSKAKMVEIPVATVYDKENLSNYSIIGYSIAVIFDALNYKLKILFGRKGKNKPEGEIKDYWRKSRHDWHIARKKGNIFERVFFYLKGKFILSKVDYRDKVILDCGCGTGVYTYEIARNSKMTIGLDISKWAIERANERKGNIKNIQFQVGDAENLRFKDNTFDVVVNTALFQYYRDPRDMIREIKRVLKPKGIVICEVPYKYGLYGIKGVIKHLTSKKDFSEEPINRCYTKKEFESLFSSFKKIRIYNFFNFLLFGIFEKRM